MVPSNSLALKSIVVVHLRMVLRVALFLGQPVAFCVIIACIFFKFFDAVKAWDIHGSGRDIFL